MLEIQDGSQTRNVPIFSDACLEAEVSPRGSLEAAKVLPWPPLQVLMPHLGLLPRPRGYRLGLAYVWMLWYCIFCQPVLKILYCAFSES